MKKQKAVGPHSSNQSAYRRTSQRQAAKFKSKVTNEKPKAIPVLNMEENEINNNNPPTNHPPNPPNIPPTNHPPNPPTNTPNIHRGLIPSSNVKRTRSSISRETVGPKKVPVKVVPRINIKDVHPVKMRERYHKNKANQNRGKAIATNDDFDFVPLNIRKQNMKKRSIEERDEGGPKETDARKEKKNNPTKAKIQTGDVMKPKTIQLRTSPKVLHSAMHNLKKATQEYVREIGLGHLLQMKVDGSPTEIGYYAVKNFDPKNMVLKVNKGVIKITREHVHKLLGLPLGRVKIDNMEYRSKEDKTVDDWYNQFDGRKDIRPHAVKEAITCAEQPDLMFKVNLFVLLCNTLGKTNSMGTCDISMLPKVTKDLDLSDFDWCSYVLKCLEDTRFSWNESRATSYYFGPIILLTLLYVECVRFDGFKIERGIPAICYWTVDNMRKREELELNSVGLGDGEIVENIGANKEESIEGYLLSFEELYDQIVKSRLELDAKIKEANEKFPNNMEIEQWRPRFNAFFGISSEEEDNM